jgi:hypothetical protein
MPRLPIDYSKTIIYKIVCNDLNITDVYVGSTTDFIRRKSEHRKCCNNEKSKKYNYKVYQTIRVNGGWDNFTMVEIEKYPCIDSNEAHTRERYYFELLNAKLNTKVPNRSEKEYRKQYVEINNEKITERKKYYREDNKEKFNEYTKKYREANKDKISEQRKKYREANKEKIAEYTKKYREANKDKISEQRKQYREANKNKIN